VPACLPWRMPDLKDTVALNLRRERYAKGLTQEDLAERIGISARYLGQVERGQSSASVTVLGRIAEALGIDARELLRPRRNTRPRRVS
jgi:transcriptional regulator with XRE-family HTH domain